MHASELTPPQARLLADLSARAATARATAVSLKSSQGKTAAFLARRRLIAVDIHRSTLRQIAWLTAAGTKVATEVANVVGPALGA